MDGWVVKMLCVGVLYIFLSHVPNFLASADRNGNVFYVIWTC